MEEEGKRGRKGGREEGGRKEGRKEGREEERREEGEIEERGEGGGKSHTYPSPSMWMSTISEGVNV